MDMEGKHGREKENDFFHLELIFQEAKINFCRFAGQSKKNPSSIFNSVKLTIRKATGAEAETVVEIGRTTFYETWKSVNTEEDLQEYMSKSFDPEKIRSELNDTAVNIFLLVYADQELAGYAKLRNDRTFHQLAGRHSLEMERIYVLKKYHDQKAGKALMDESISIARAGNYVVLWLGVNQENIRAIDFYKRYGFEIFGTKKFVLGKAVDEDFLMKLELT